MTHSTTGRARAIALTVAALVSVPVLAGTAAAAPADMYAPYARATAKVAANGTLLAAKNIAAVTRPQVGMYCVKVSDPDIDDLTNADILATSNGGFVTLRVYGQPTGQCASAPNTITIFSNVSNTGAWADTAFTVSVQ